MLGDTLNILIVEDDADTRDNLRDILELDGHRIDEAATAAEALDREDWSAYATILLDRKLPDGTAADLLPRLRRLAPTSAVIVVTGHADVDGAIEASAKGPRIICSSRSTPTSSAPNSGGSRSTGGWRRRIESRNGSPGQCSTRWTRTSPSWTTRARSWLSTKPGAVSPRRTGPGARTSPRGPTTSRPAPGHG